MLENLKKAVKRKKKIKPINEKKFNMNYQPMEYVKPSRTMMARLAKKWLEGQ